MRGIGVETVQDGGGWEIQINDSRGQPLMRMSPNEGSRLAERFADQGHHDLAMQLRRCCADAASRNIWLKRTQPNAAGNFVVGQAICPGPVEEDGSPT